MVKKGDFLAQIDPRPYQVALEQAQGTLARDQALLQERAARPRSATRRCCAQDSHRAPAGRHQAALVQQYEGTVATDQARGRHRQAQPHLLPHRLAGDGRVGLRQVDPATTCTTGDANGIVVDHPAPADLA